MMLTLMSWLPPKTTTDNYRVYDRKKISSISIAEESQLASCETIDCSKFRDEGLLMLNPDIESEFWANALAAYQTDGTASVKVDDAGLFIIRGSEAKTLPFNFKTFPSSTIYKLSESKNTGVTGGKCVADVKDNQLEMMFYNIKPTTEPFNILSIFLKELESYQNSDGSFSVKRPAYRILNHRISAKVSIIDEE